MKRRLFITAVPLGLGAVSCAALAQPAFRISAKQLQQALDARFPQRHPIGQLLSLTIFTPRLEFLPEINRLALHTIVEAAGPALRRAERGGFDIDFALRYEPQDMTIRASQLQVRALELPGIAPSTAQLLDVYAKVLASQTMLEVVLHRLRPRDLELPEAMGLRPGDIKVAADGLVVGFVPK
jgi:hypothetical protein